MRKYAGQQLTTGPQAEAYADHFIAVHLSEVAGGQTYSQVSAASQADPTNATLKTEAQTLFQGTTLRGLLLNAFAFSKIGQIAGWASVASFIAARLLLILGAGFAHASRETGPASSASGRKSRPKSRGPRRPEPRDGLGPAAASPPPARAGTLRGFSR